MDQQAYLKHFIGNLHRDYGRALEDLTDAQFYHQPSANTNHIAFTAWHWVRTEDNVVNFVLQWRNTVWLERGLDQAWNLPKAAQGTGMPHEEAYAMRLPSVGAFVEYARGVWAATDRYLDTVTPEELSRVTKVMPFGEVPVLQALGQTLVAHGNQHLGEIWLTRELQGLKGIGV
jgi:DinB superfamily